MSGGLFTELIKLLVSSRIGNKSQPSHSPVLVINKLLLMHVGPTLPAFFDLPHVISDIHLKSL